MEVKTKEEIEFTKRISSKTLTIGFDIHVDNETAQNIATIKNLSELTMLAKNIDDDALQIIMDIPTLVDITFEDCEISKKAIEIIANSKKIVSMSFNNTSIDGKDLVKLTTMNNIASLLFSDIDIAPDDKKAILQNLKENENICEISGCQDMKAIADHNDAKIMRLLAGVEYQFRTEDNVIDDVWQMVNGVLHKVKKIDDSEDRGLVLERLSTDMNVPLGILYRNVSDNRNTGLKHIEIQSDISIYELAQQRNLKHQEKIKEKQDVILQMETSELFDKNNYDFFEKMHKQKVFIGAFEQFPYDTQSDFLMAHSERILVNEDLFEQIKSVMEESFANGNITREDATKIRLFDFAALQRG